MSSNHEYEYAVMYVRYSTNDPHRGPFPTLDETQAWVDAAEADGFCPGVMKVFRRPTGKWEEV